MLNQINFAATASVLIAHINICIVQFKMLSIQRLSRNANIYGLAKTINHNKNAISAFVNYNKTFMTDATLINKNKLVNEECVISTA